MAVDTPATIAILGAGPIGLEAALYARYLGYDVLLYERGPVASGVRKWGHIRMFTPFGMNRSPLGLAALSAQDESYQPPRDDEYLKGGEYVARYLEPLAHSDLLVDSLRLEHEVLAVGRENFLRHELPGAEERGDFDFRLLVRDDEGQESIVHADVLIDATGVTTNSRWLGCAGVPCPGERELRDQIHYGWPDILGTDRQRFAGRHTLVIGGGDSAATHIIALAKLAGETSGTRVTWITRREPTSGQSGPIKPSNDPRLTAQHDVAAAANAACVAGGAVAYWPLTDVESICREDNGGYVLELSGEHNGTLACDEVIASVGHRSDLSLCGQLQLASDPASGAIPLAQPEPNFYTLGAKSTGSGQTFLIADGLRQIVAAFSVIGDRETLDLYARANQGN